MSTTLRPSMYTSVNEYNSSSGPGNPVANETAGSVVTAQPRQHITEAITTLVSTVLDNVTSYLNVSSEPICTHPAFHEFPPDAFTSEQRADGAIIIHLLVTVYMFMCLAVVCDDYFVASLDKICESTYEPLLQSRFTRDLQPYILNFLWRIQFFVYRWLYRYFDSQTYPGLFEACLKLGFSEDVAGATFMAAGSSAPELFIAVIGVFITKGDVGVGTIVGSAVFNILFVIGICAITVKQAITLSWWPLFRDAIYYAIAVIVLIIVLADSVVTWYESLIMLLLYVGYILIMRFNRTLQSLASEKLHWLTTEKLDVNGIMSKQLTKFQGDYEAFGDDDDVFNHSQETTEMTEYDLSHMSVDHYVKMTTIRLTFEEAAFRIVMGHQFPGRARFRAAARLVISYRQRMRRDAAYFRRRQFQNIVQRSSMRSYTKSVRNWMSMNMEGDDYDAWKSMPAKGGGFLLWTRWLLIYPIKSVLYYTIPDCRKHKWEPYFIATFVISILWIAIFSYIMVWMVVYVGYAFHIPDSVMGITFLAAGTSIPDAMASVIVARQGMGDMAVSNCVGSNIFDILLGLSFPWFLKTAVVDPGSIAHINSSGLMYAIMMLFATLVITVATIHLYGWQLSRSVGFIFLGVYAVYLLFATMIECNVFAFVNPPMCRE